MMIVPPYSFVVTGWVSGTTPLLLFYSALNTSMSGLLILSLSCLLGLCLPEVMVLTDQNFDGYVAQNEVVLVEFYAPWCSHCKKLEPEYDEASQQLGPDEGKLAKVDTTVEKKLGERFKIQGYPTLKLFRNGNPSDYKDGRTAANIVGYMQKQSGPAVKELKDASQLKAFIPTDEGADPVVVAFAESGTCVHNPNSPGTPTDQTHSLATPPPPPPKKKSPS